MSTTEQAPPAMAHRRARASELARRRRILIGYRPAADPAVVNAVACNDGLWAAGEPWRAALDAGAPRLADPPPGAGTPDVLAAEVAPPASPAGPDVPPARPRRRTVRARWRPWKPAPPPPADGDLAGIAAPGSTRRPRVPGRRQIWLVRLALTVAPLVLVGGSAFAAGVHEGSARLPQAAEISPAMLRAYGLTTYPVAAAAAFGAAYLGQCLTHPDPADGRAAAARAADLAAMTSGGVPGGCGWDGTGKATAPISVSWDGSAEPVAGYQTGQAARLGYRVTLPAGTLRVIIPVWASSPQGSFRVVGPLGMMPAPPAPPAPPPDSPLPTDPQLATQITGAVLTPFLTAWAAGNAVQLNLLLTSTAGPAAQQGMGGLLSDPVIGPVSAVVVTGTPGAYTDGDAVVALATVTWAAATGGQQTASYAITLHRQAARWLVSGITGSTLDHTGGAAQPGP